MDQHQVENRKEAASTLKGMMDDSSSKKAPTFRGLLEQMKQEKSHAKPTIFDNIEVDIPTPKGQTRKKESNKGIVEELVEKTTRSRKSIDLNKIQRPTYEDIEERRRRISRQL